MTILWLPVMTAFELVKRVIGLFVYPVAYYCGRTWPRTRKGLLWAFLDDSIVVDSINRGYGPIEWCGYGKTEPLGKLACTPFLKAYNWGALRNSAINLRDVMALGPELGVVKHIGGDRHYYEVGQFKAGNRPYFQFWMGEHFRVQCGWVHGGWFQVQANKK